MEIELDVVMTAPGDRAGYHNDRARRCFMMMSESVVVTHCFNVRRRFGDYWMLFAVDSRFPVL